MEILLGILIFIFIAFWIRKRVLKKNKKQKNISPISKWLARQAENERLKKEKLEFFSRVKLTDDQLRSRKAFDVFALYIAQILQHMKKDSRRSCPRNIPDWIQKNETLLLTGFELSHGFCIESAYRKGDSKMNGNRFQILKGKVNRDLTNKFRLTARQEFV